ncbi:MAG: lipoyl synthase, partial [Clostridia bacterium]|nr:lipoyl synthase [Deltaproteobacteria bacterium]
MPSVINGAPIARAGEHARRPPWMRVKVQNTETYKDVKALLKGLNLNTVCEEARCPNIWECWGEHKTATFMILGEVCTRNCRYCSVISGRPQNLPDAKEPDNVAEAVHRLGISHAVITSVDRDDLPDYGAGHFVRTIEAIRNRRPSTKIEVLIPDFMGDEGAQHAVFEARPEVLNHNTETVPRLYKAMRSKGIYSRCLELLARADKYRRGDNPAGAPVAMTTKTGIICGLGETIDELLLVMDDLRKVDCDVLTFGQYLNPTKKHAPIARFYTPDEFYKLKEEGLKRGFKHVESGPLVRSS